MIEGPWSQTEPEIETGLQSCRVEHDPIVESYSEIMLVVMIAVL